MLEFIAVILIIYLFLSVIWRFARRLTDGWEKEQKYIVVREYYVPLDDELVDDAGEVASEEEEIPKRHGKPDLKIVK